MYGLKLVEYVSTTHVWFETSKSMYQLLTYGLKLVEYVPTTHVWFGTSRVHINYSRMV